MSLRSIFAAINNWLKKQVDDPDDIQHILNGKAVFKCPNCCKEFSAPINTTADCTHCGATHKTWAYVHDTLRGVWKVGLGDM